MTSTSLQLATTEKFGNVQTNIYEDNNNEMYMTIAQLAECLGYAGKNGIKSLISRNSYLRDVEFSREVTLCNPLDNSKAGQLTRVFNEDGIYEVTFLSNTPKALEFHRWVRQLLKSLRKGEYRIEKNGAIFSQELFDAAIQKYLPCINTKNLNIWKAQTVKPLITTLSEKLQIDTRTAYDLVYNHMTSKYGFSRSFAITQFCDKYRVAEASVIDAIADDYTLQSWLVQSINDIMDYVNNVSLATSELNTIQSRRTFSLSDSVADIVSEVSAVNGDRSANHARTYGKIYSEITTKSGWKNLRTRYGGSNKDIVESNIKYKKKFIAVANKMMNNKGE
jgi:prophage antirepressor-like protein